MREPDPDRYLAALEDRHAQRIGHYDDEREERMARENDLYAKYAHDVDLLMAGINPDTGQLLKFDDEGRLLDEEDPEMADDADDRESRLDRLASDADWQNDCDRDREMEERP